MYQTTARRSWRRLREKPNKAARAANPPTLWILKWRTATETKCFPAAVEVILETGQASVSMLQRRLKLGYARAARIVDEMEEKGIVGPFMGSKPRNILITKEQWQQMQSGLPMEEPEPEEPVPEEIL
ncbi:MAG: DNA translocase FtsK [Oscillospiraceae bacterium]